MKRINTLLLIAAMSAQVVALVGCTGFGEGSKNEKKGIPIAEVVLADGQGTVFVDVDGNIAIDARQYASARTFSEGLCAVRDKESGQMGFVDTKGELVIPCQYPSTGVYNRVRDMGIRKDGMFHKGYARVGSSNNAALIDRKGNRVLGGYAAMDWDGKVAIVGQGDTRRLGLVAMDGKELVPVGTYSNMRFIGEGMLACRSANGSGWCIIDRKGRQLEDNIVEKKDDGFIYSRVGEFVEGYVTAQVRDGSWRVMDKRGNVVKLFGKKENGHETFYGIMPVFSEGLKVAQDNKTIINSQFQEVGRLPENVSDHAGQYSDGMLAVMMRDDRRNRRWGFVDREGNLVVPCTYTSDDYNYPPMFSEGLAFVSDGTDWHIIDKTGAEVGALKDMNNVSAYQLVPFCAGRAVIKKGIWTKNYTIVDQQGNVIETPEAERISGFYYSDNDNSELGESY